MGRRGTRSLSVENSLCKTDYAIIIIIIISFDYDRFSHTFVLIPYVLIILSFASIVTGNYGDVK